MSKGGKRDGAGRKKIGKILNVRIEIDILDQIDKLFEGHSRAEKIRKCLEEGIKNKNNINK